MYENRIGNKRQNQKAIRADTFICSWPRNKHVGSGDKNTIMGSIKGITYYLDKMVERKPFTIVSSWTFSSNMDIEVRERFLNRIYDLAMDNNYDMVKTPHADVLEDYFHFTPSEA